MNQDIRDALARLVHALENEARADGLLHVRLAEQEAIAARERARADAAERKASEYSQAILRAADDYFALERRLGEAHAEIAILQTEYVVFKTGREACDDASNI
jgi:hypothetical protein